jgi:hypothetical protein
LKNQDFNNTMAKTYHRYIKKHVGPNPASCSVGTGGFFAKVKVAGAVPQQEYQVS